ncbi:tRNA pseudouridine(55) synthase TruB [Desulfococcus sp.]|uniref:tRNA pseudouridine(55) synthase TruB n=1 Tax=Desulfococcus sp. TaxID=2025834 RepID=UPI00359386CD
MQKLTSGILVVDKPEGITSAGVVALVKRRIHADKVGHCGTLDPFASGVLVCCINQATRISRFFLHGDKSYEAVLRLGVETDTQDVTGKIVSASPVTVTEDAIRSAFDTLVGPVRQQPPVYSALKHEGVPLYKLARSGRPMQKPARDIVIHRLSVLAVDLPDVHFGVTCSGGTYVRTLAADLGRMLGCGAHLRKLVRTASGPFTLAQAAALAEIASLDGPPAEMGRMIEMNEALAFIPKQTADPRTAEKVRHGMPLTESDIRRPEPDGGSDWLRVVDPDDRLIAILAVKKENSGYNYCCVFN